MVAESILKHDDYGTTFMNGAYFVMEGCVCVCYQQRMVQRKIILSKNSGHDIYVFQPKS